MISRRAERDVLLALGATLLAALVPAFGRGTRKQVLNDERQPPPRAFELFRGNAVHFPVTPLTFLASSIGCDARGNIYALPGAMDSIYLRQGPITGVFPDSKKVVRYPLPAIPDYRPLSLHGFAVSPNGGVYALAVTVLSQHRNNPKPAYFIVKYNDDGTADSYFRVSGERGTRIQPLKISVFSDGDFLLSGTTVLKGGMGTFSGIFDRQGTLITPLKLGEAVTHGGPVSAKESAKLWAKSVSKWKKLSRAQQLEASGKNPVSFESSMLSFSSQDDNVFVLQGTSGATLYVVSPAGEVARQYHLEPPEAGMSPVQMAQAGVGYLFIYYTRIGRSAAANSSPDYITVLSSETGKVAEVYRMPISQNGLGIPACADSPDDFLFLGASKNNHLEVVRYVSR